MAICRFTPPNPNALTLALRGISGAFLNHGLDSEFTYKGELSILSLGFGFVTLIVPGKILLCNASAALIIPATPAAALVCPICDFTLPKAM